MARAKKRAKRRAKSSSRSTSKTATTKRSTRGGRNRAPSTGTKNGKTKRSTAKKGTKKGTKKAAKKATTKKAAKKATTKKVAPKKAAPKRKPSRGVRNTKQYHMLLRGYQRVEAAKTGKLRTQKAIERDPKFRQALRDLDSKSTAPRGKKAKALEAFGLRDEGFPLAVGSYERGEYRASVRDLLSLD